MVSLRSLVVSAALVAVPVLAVLGPEEIANGLDTLSRKFQVLQGPAQGITVVDATLIVIDQGSFPPIITRLTDIVSTGNALHDQIIGTPEIVDGPDIDLVVSAWHNFVHVQQTFLNILIEKAGIFQQAVPLVGTRVAAVLRSVEGVDDSLGNVLINTVTAEPEDIEPLARSLAVTIETCIREYDGLSV